MKKDIYLICPVRNATAEDKLFADNYVQQIEKSGKTVHYPPRDVDQTEDGIGFAISDTHRQVMADCSEVHIIWDAESKGSHFDLGMAFMLEKLKGIKIVVARPFEKSEKRSYGNLIKYIEQLQNEKAGSS